MKSFSLKGDLSKRISDNLSKMYYLLNDNPLKILFIQSTREKQIEIFKGGINDLSEYLPYRRDHL